MRPKVQREADKEETQRHREEGRLMTEAISVGVATGQGTPGIAVTNRN